MSFRKKLKNIDLLDIVLRDPFTGTAICIGIVLIFLGICAAVWLMYYKK